MSAIIASTFMIEAVGIVNSALYSIWLPVGIVTTIYLLSQIYDVVVLAKASAGFHAPLKFRKTTGRFFVLTSHRPPEYSMVGGPFNMSDAAWYV